MADIIEARAADGGNFMKRLSKGLRILGWIWLDSWIILIILVGFLDNWRNFPTSLDDWLSRTVLINSSIVLAGLLFGGAIVLVARRLDQKTASSIA